MLSEPTASLYQTPVDTMPRCFPSHPPSLLPSLHLSLYLCSCSNSENHSPSGHPQRGRLPQSNLLRNRKPTVSAHQCVCFPFTVVSVCAWVILMDVKACVKFCFYMCFKNESSELVLQERLSSSDDPKRLRWLSIRLNYNRWEKPASGRDSLSFSRSV